MLTALWYCGNLGRTLIGSCCWNATAIIKFFSPQLSWMSPRPEMVFGSEGWGHNWRATTIEYAQPAFSNMYVRISAPIVIHQIEMQMCDCVYCHCWVGIVVIVSDSVDVANAAVVVYEMLSSSSTLLMLFLHIWSLTLVCRIRKFAQIVIVMCFIARQWGSTIIAGDIRPNGANILLWMPPFAFIVRIN